MEAGGMGCRGGGGAPAAPGAPSPVYSHSGETPSAAQRMRIKGRAERSSVSRPLLPVQKARTAGGRRGGMLPPSTSLLVLL